MSALLYKQSVHVPLNVSIPGEDITEVEESGFSTTETTLHVGNIQGYVVQVCPMSILLLQDTTILHRLEVSSVFSVSTVFSVFV